MAINSRFQGENKMFWNRKNKKQKKPNTITLQRFQPFFTTIDNVLHEGIDRYKWANADGLLCTVPEYLMIDIKSDGYMKDKNDVMYPIQNIVSIEWKLLEEKIVLDNFYHKWNIFFDDKEVEEMNILKK